MKELLKSTRFPRICGQAVASLRWRVSPRHLVDRNIERIRQLGENATGVAGVWIVPATPELAVQDRYLAAEVGGETVLSLHLRGLAEERFDCVLLDSPPQVGMLSLNVLTAAEELVIPVAPDPLALDGLAQVFETESGGGGGAGESGVRAGRPARGGRDDGGPVSLRGSPYIPRYKPMCVRVLNGTWTSA